MSSLRDKTISGVFWSFLQKVGSKGIEIVITIILARILTPKDFGLIGMLAIFIALSQTLVQAGFNQALIQKKDTDEEDYSSVFYINLLIGFCLYITLFFSAPLISDFYDQPQLTSLTRVLSLVFIINAFSHVQETRLIKALKFKKLMYIHLPSTLISGTISITMAYLGYGVWSIVAQRIVMRLTYTLQIWIYAHWIPLWSFNLTKTKRLFSFGGNLMISGLINTIYHNFYLIIIGKFFPINTLGYYQNAKKLVDVPSNTLAQVVKSVTFPIFSEIQDDNKRLKEGFKQSILQILFWLCPLLTLAAVLARPLFHFVLTDKWMPAVPFFQLLCIVGVIYPINSYSMNIINVKGHSGLVLKLDLIKKAIVIIGIVFAIPMGIWAVVIFQPIYVLLAYGINSYFLGRFIDYSLKEQLKDISPIFILSVIMGAIVFLVDYRINNFADLSRIFIGIILGGSIYGLVSWKTKYLPLMEFGSIFQQFRKKIKNKKKN